MTRINIPNLLTLLRIILVPVFVTVFYLPWKGSHLACAMLFLFASLTDWLDGYLARILQQTSAFGRFLDPVADKIIVAVALVLIVGQYQSQFQLSLAIPAAIIVSREIVISALREWMAEIGKSKNIAVSFLGKIKTAFQMIALVLLLAQPVNIYQGLLLTTGIFLLWTSAVLTLWSMVIYLISAYRALR